jgi:16S rRNA (cytosine967-C5)-methyltransferase
MPGESAKSARMVAAEVLQQFDPKHSYAGPVLDRLLSETQEKQRATDLVLGTIRNLRAIDTVVGKFSGRAVQRIAPALLAAIRIGVYELAYSPDTPVYSIVNEAVNTAKSTGGAKQSGFVNAVLRQTGRHILSRQAQLDRCPPSRTLIQSAGAGCEFDTDILPDPAVSGAAYLSACFSLPQWLVSDWIGDFGFAQARSICIASNRRPSVYLRVNPLRTTAANLMDRLTSEGVKAELALIEGCQIIKVSSPRSVAELPGFAEGWFTIQDVSASSAVRLLDPQAGWTILDLCAAPGTKTTQLAEATRDTGTIRATDRDAGRLSRVTQNVQRLGLRSVEVVPYEQLELGSPAFDAVLLDTPCSNTGVLARRIEVRYRITPTAVAELAATQRGLLGRVVALVKPGGRICYSTCSILKAENTDLIRQYVAADNRVELVKEELVLPSAEGFDRDGAYVAILERRR